MFNFYFRNSYRLWDDVWKCRRTKQATDDNRAHAHCMPDTWGYIHTLRTCNTNCFSTATLVTRTPTTVNIYTYVAYPVLFFTFHNNVMIAAVMGSCCVTCTVYPTCMALKNTAAINTSVTHVLYDRYLFRPLKNCLPLMECKHWSAPAQLRHFDPFRNATCWVAFYRNILKAGKSAAGRPAILVAMQRGCAHPVLPLSMFVSVRLYNHFLLP